MTIVHHLSRWHIRHSKQALLCIIEMAAITCAAWLGWNIGELIAPLIS